MVYWNTKILSTLYSRTNVIKIKRQNVNMFERMNKKFHRANVFFSIAIKKTSNEILTLNNTLLINESI